MFSKTAYPHSVTATTVFGHQRVEGEERLLSAIKKYLAANYKVGSAKLTPFIVKVLKVAIANGTVIQTKGNGASGHFKLPVDDVKPKKAIVAKKKKSIYKKLKHLEHRKGSLRLQKSHQVRGTRGQESEEGCSCGD
ncbi:histone H1.1-like [Acyrthosiphon pisum]|uniref:H15 domain-containing protein n=1 Tax=Acyrthosiphon pisum TaxID=7029 RepID=A0A8R1WYA1_ACYPI|nr:histone H1.1-like [Acyrthosiphon pisum]|eukprot:XP_008179018.1 PREDICTED: histone H1.1-like [Acyrthosiphon pisum]